MTNEQKKTQKTRIVIVLKMFCKISTVTLPLSLLAFLLVSQPSFPYVSVWPPASSYR